MRCSTSQRQVSEHLGSKVNFRARKLESCVCDPGLSFRVSGFATWSPGSRIWHQADNSEFGEFDCVCRALARSLAEGFPDFESEGLQGAA